ncbi:MAG: porin [Bacteroidetes bacterium]|nr:porin [Bacteroidota bacterium]
MNILSKSIAVCMLLLISSLSLHAGGFQLNEHGARAMAQGGAWAARAYDGSAIFFNPAGLGFQKIRSLYLGTTIIMPAASFYGPTNLGQNAKNEMVSQVFTPINLYATVPVMENLVVGIGINNPYGLGTEWPEDWTGRYITQKIDLMSFFFTPTAAYKVSDNLSIGVGLNYATGNVTLSRMVSPGDAQVKLDLSGTGMGFTGGVIFKPTEALSVGVSYRSSVKIDAEGTAEFTPSSALFPAGDAAATLELPATAFVGVAYKVMDNLEVEADYQFVGWSSYKELKIDFKKNNTSSVSPKNYEDTYILRLGGEYTMEAMQIRFGYLFDRNPVADHYTEPLLPDSDRNGFNIGVGYKINETMSVDASYLFLKFAERKVTGTEVEFDGVYQSNANLFGINFGYTF